MEDNNYKITNITLYFWCDQVIGSPIHEKRTHQCSPLNYFNTGHLSSLRSTVDRANVSLVLEGEQEKVLFDSSAYFFYLPLPLFLSLSHSHAGGIAACA